MKRTRLIVAALIGLSLAAIVGYWLGSRGASTAGSNSMAAKDSVSDQRKVLYWKAPMDANFRRDKPGKSPMGMDLVPVYAGAGGDETGDIKINPRVVNNLGVRTALVQQGSLSNRLEAVGYVTYDEDTITSINTRADGWVEKLAVKTVGSNVESGQLLYELFSPKMQTAQREYQIAMTSGNRSLISASRQRMRSLGFTAGQIAQVKRGKKISDRIARRAQGAGVVVALGVREGTYVQPATQVMKLADLSTVWLQVEIDESSASLLHKGQKATATFDAFPDRRWQGTVNYIYPDLNAKTRTVKVRLRFANPDRRLQPNMYAHVAIQAAPQSDVVYIPEQALIRTGQSQRVIVALGKGRFNVCPVEAGISSGDQVEILKGLGAGQRVVTSAQFMIDSEANVNAAALRLGSGKAGCTTKPEMTGKGMSDMAADKPAMKPSGTKDGIGGKDSSEHKPSMKRDDAMDGNAGSGMPKSKSMPATGSAAALP